MAEAAGADGCSGWMELEYGELRQEEGRLYGRSHPDKNIPQIFSHPLPTRPKKWLYGEGGFARFISLTDLLSTLRIKACVSSQGQSTLPRQPAETAKGIVQAEKEDLFNVVTLKRGKQSSRAPPASTTHRVT